MASTQTEHSHSSSQSTSKSAAISTMVVRTMSEYTGRGPTKARTYLNGDLVTVVLQDTLTTGERSLVAEGLHELVLTMRKAFHGTMRHDLVSGIEEILGRKVIAFMSDNHIAPDAAVEVFMIAPDDAGAQADRHGRAARTPKEFAAGG